VSTHDGRTRKMAVGGQESYQSAGTRMALPSPTWHLAAAEQYSGAEVPHQPAQGSSGTAQDAMMAGVTRRGG
jgi:hypothetical protein